MWSTRGRSIFWQYVRNSWRWVNTGVEISVMNVLLFVFKTISNGECMLGILHYW